MRAMRHELNSDQFAQPLHTWIPVRAFMPSKAAVSVALYLFFTACVELLRRFAPLPADATMFQIVQRTGGVGGGWLVSYMP